MDIDPNFNESEALFYDALDHLRRPDGEGSDQEDQEERKGEEPTGEKEPNGEEQKAEEAKEESKTEESKELPTTAPKPKKPVKFLERPKDVRNQYQGYDDMLSEEDDEDRLLDSLQQQMGLTKPEVTAEATTTSETAEPTVNSESG